jgi:hypothetical protein
MALARTQAEKLNLMNKLFTILYEKIEDADLRYENIFPITVVRIESEDDDIGQLISYIPTRSPDGKIADINICYECISGSLQLSAEKINFEQGGSLNTKPTKTNMTIIENKFGFVYRLSSTSDSQIVDAATVTKGPSLENRSEKKFSYYKNQERQYEGRSIYHSMFDFAVYPNPHIAWSYLEQWGEYNEYLSGFSLSLAGPGLGLGVAIFKALSSNPKLLVGTKVYANVFNVLQRTITGDSNSEEEETETEEGEEEEERGPPDGVISDNLITVAIQVRYELLDNGRLGIIAFANTDASFGVGLSF